MLNFLSFVFLADIIQTKKKDSSFHYVPFRMTDYCWVQVVGNRRRFDFAQDKACMGLSTCGAAELDSVPQ